MRGAKFPQKHRSVYEIPAVDEAVSQAVTVVSPVKGWNARSALASMRPDEAVLLDNIFPTTSGVSLREGRLKHAYNLPHPVKSLVTYNNGASSSFWAATDAGFYNITTSGDKTGAPALGTLTSGWVETAQISSAGGVYLVSVNGVDKLQLFDGTTWASIDGASTPAITGVTTSTLSHVCLFKKRLWFIERNSLNAWYLNVDSIGGAATKFPLGAVFSKGGHLVAQATWTIDGGNGLDDYLVTATDQGQIAVYQGTDPTTAATFALVGVFEVGEPVGKKCFVKYGGDLLYISRYGITPLSKLLQSQVLDRSVAISYQIDSVFSAYAEEYGDNKGWHPVLVPSKNALIVNVPVNETGTSYQLVMNTITKAWCRFTGWTSNCLAVYDTLLYSATGTTVYLTWFGKNDDGVAVTGLCQSAYTNYGSLGQKHVELAKLNLQVDGPAVLTLSLLNDFSDQDTTSTIGVGSAIPSTSTWDVSLWDAAIWSTDGSQPQANWLTIPNNPGYFHSLRLQIVASSATISWTSTDYAIKKLGIL